MYLLLLITKPLLWYTTFPQHEAEAKGVTEINLSLLSLNWIRKTSKQLHIFVLAQLCTLITIFEITELAKSLKQDIMARN